MAFAIFYSTADMVALQTAAISAIADARLKGQLKTKATGYWNGGIKDWQTAPLTTPEEAAAHNLNIDPGDTRTIVVTYGSLADLIATLYQIVAIDPAWGFLHAVASDLGVGGGVEPWP